MVVGLGVGRQKFAQVLLENLQRALKQRKRLFRFRRVKPEGCKPPDEFLLVSNDPPAVEHVTPSRLNPTVHDRRHITKPTRCRRPVL